MNVYEKMMNVQSKLKAPKNQYNSFGKYNYRNCEDILEALKPLLAEYKAIVNLTDKIVHIEGRFYVEATAKFIDIEKGEIIEVAALAREDEVKKGMDLAQVTGSVSSYARKYALNGLFCIDDTKDSDATNTHGKENATGGETEVKQLSDAQLKRLFAIAHKNNYNEETVKKAAKKYYGTDDLKTLSKANYDDLCNRMDQPK